MKIDKKTVDHIAKLSRLEFSNSNQDMFLKHFENVLSNFDKLAKINTDGIQPTAHVIAKHNVLRDDVFCDSMPAEQLLMNAPDKEDTAYLVPKVVE